MTWLLVVSLVGMVLAVLVVLESFRPEPVWVRPDRSASPRQRRWLGFGLIFNMAGNILNWYSSVGEADLGTAAFGLILLGLLVIVVGIAKGPTDAELERRARLLARDG